MSSARFAHIETNDTLPKLLRHNAKHHGGDVAQREKDRGLWKSYSWSDVHERARLWGLGFKFMGAGRGDTIAIVGDSRPDWVAAAIGAHAVGAMTLGLYQDGLEAELSYLLAFAEVKVVVAENEEQVDKILRMADSAPSIKAIVYNDPRGMRKYNDPRLLHCDA
ncbi:MAG: AMP-binding protein, partial [Hyphomicrobiaceae bacterium]